MSNLAIYTNGTYLPTVRGTTIAGTTTYAANGQMGHYTRIGNLCFVSGRVQWTAQNGTTDIQVSLPFTAKNTTFYRSTLAVATAGLSYAGSYVIGQIRANEDFFVITSSASGGVITLVPVAPSGIVSFSGFFEIED